MYRIQYQKGKEWIFVCPTCLPFFQEGDFYRYGGTWKGYRHRISKVGKLSVLGTKDFNDEELLRKELSKEAIDVMVVGGKSGADLFAEQYALDNEIPIQVFLPEFPLHGRSANYERNLQMIRNSIKIIVFWNHRSKSPFNYLPYIREQKKVFRTVIY